jgi:queuine tRNA-ribosyltransferase
MHNLHFLLALMTAARTAILNDSYPDFIRAYFRKLYRGETEKYPAWAVTALRGVNVDLLT